MVDSILFDLDGTLWNAVSSTLPAWQRVAQEEAGISLTYDDPTSIMGLTPAEIGARFFPSFPPAEQLRLAMRGCREECIGLAETGGILYPGVPETLRALSRSYPLMIVSNCMDGYIQAFLKAHRLEDCFADYEYPERSGLLKDGNIRLVAERNRLSHPVYVGDTQKDADSAKAAGVPFLFASYGFGDVREEDYLVHLQDFRQLPSVLAGL